MTLHSVKIELVLAYLSAELFAKIVVGAVRALLTAVTINLLRALIGFTRRFDVVICRGGGALRLAGRQQEAGERAKDHLIVSIERSMRPHCGRAGA